jgi:hypothetical protein
MNAIALILVACLPHSNTCKSIVQHPAPATKEECSERAEELQMSLAGSIDDGGYRPLQVTCLYGPDDRDGG